jgi:K+ transporter|tara:strand:+ start:3795 stop:4292 length:498 start_codon:yes stop_codon:yes gene_type:complete
MKIEQLTKAKIKVMNKEELFELLKNYGVALKDITNYEESKLLESALELKDKSAATQKKIAEAEKPQEAVPDLTKEDKDDPVKSLFEMGYNTQEDVQRALQAIKNAKKELELKEQEFAEKAEIITQEEAKLEEKRKSVNIKLRKLEEEYKTWQEWHDKVIAAKKST